MEGASVRDAACTRALWQAACKWLVCNSSCKIQLQLLLALLLAVLLAVASVWVVVVHRCGC
jgi:hypothetical protein